MPNAADDKAIAVNLANNDGNPPKLQINPDGTWEPSSVTINAGGVLQIDVDFPNAIPPNPPPNVCTITFASVTFSYEPPTADPSGTIKIGS